LTVESELPVLRALRRVALAQWWDGLRSCPRALEPLRLTRFGHKTFSQNDEDGIVLEIFNRIGVRSRQFVEFGVQGGTECNTALLLAAGWTGLWLDSSAKDIDAVKTAQSDAIVANRLSAVNAFVTAENISTLLGDWRATISSSNDEIDLLSIDIDGNDYWVWKSMETIRSRVVVIEYNASYPPPVDFLVPYAPDAVWNETNYFGASLTMLEKLGRAKGYALVGCCLAGVNAFFVREDELAGSDGKARFHAPFTAAEHYEPPRYGLCDQRIGGHRPGFGPNVALQEAACLTLNKKQKGL
jgi:hypothetical protein